MDGPNASIHAALGPTADIEERWGVCRKRALQHNSKILGRLLGGAGGGGLVTP